MVLVYLSIRKLLHISVSNSYKIQTKMKKLFEKLYTWKTHKYRLNTELNALMNELIWLNF